MGTTLKNKSSRYRAARFELFHRVVKEKKLDGVVLGHHEDDQAGTVGLRLLGGAELLGLKGMSERAWIGGMVVWRPLLGVRREWIRQMLRERGISWRDDASNEVLDQWRNRVRVLLAGDESLRAGLLR